MTDIFRLPLNIAKLVEARRRTRVDRSRQIANNAELQRNMMDTIRMYNMETERRRVVNELQTSMAPPVARVVRQVYTGVIGPAPRQPPPTQAETAQESIDANRQATERNAARHVVTESIEVMRDRQAAGVNPQPTKKTQSSRTLRLGARQSYL